MEKPSCVFLNGFFPFFLHLDRSVPGSQWKEKHDKNKAKHNKKNLCTEYESFLILMKSFRFDSWVHDSTNDFQFHETSTMQIHEERCKLSIFFAYNNKFIRRQTFLLRMGKHERIHSNFNHDKTENVINIFKMSGFTFSSFISCLSEKFVLRLSRKFFLNETTTAAAASKASPAARKKRNSTREIESVFRFLATPKSVFCEYP